MGEDDQSKVFRQAVLSPMAVLVIGCPRALLFSGVSGKLSILSMLGCASWWGEALKSLWVLIPLLVLVRTISWIRI